jgi:hypothetical protein
MMDDAVAVRLTPAQAKHIAASMRIALAARLEGAWAYPLPDRADVEGLRALVNSYADELAMLEWGEPQRDVELLCQRVRLERLARELVEAGAERIDDHPIAGREASDMISAGRAINAVLARDRSRAAGAWSAPNAEGKDSTLA